MGNAVEALKSPRNVAFVTDSNAEDGVAKVLRVRFRVRLRARVSHHATDHVTQT